MTLQLLKSCLRRIPICRQCPPSAKTIRTLSTLAADPPLSQYAQLNSQLHQFAQPVQSPPHLPRHIASLDNSRFLSLSPAQKELLNLMCEGKSVYFTGKAGAGKTEVLSRFIHFRRSDPFMALKTLITAPTGIAASHISGSTLHSRFGLKPSPIPKHNSAQELVKRANADINLLSRYILTDTLVIDEVSMVNKRDFEAISVAMGLLKSDFLTCQKVVRYLTKKAEKRAKAQAKKEASRSLESTCKVTPGHSLLSELKETATDLESWNFQLDPRTFFDKDAASKPFGGAQVVLSGDFYQLPPVERESEALVQYRQFVSKQFQGKDLEWHLSPYVFTGSEWGKLVRSGMKMVMLEKSFRHGDTDFTNFLDRLRVGEWDDDMIGLLQPRILSDDSHPEVQPIKLCAYRATAQDYNSENLRKIQSPQVDFYSHDHVVEIEQLAPILKSLSESRNPYADSAISIDGSTESHESLLDAHSLDFTSLPVPALLNLRIGAQVVLSKNQRIGSGLVNGTRGKVVDFHEAFDDLLQKKVKLPIVEFKLSTSATTATGHRKRPQYDTFMVGYENFSCQVTESRAIVRRQIPLRLGWGITIHRSQGMTLDSVIVDIPRSGAFAPGQAYVAFSRVKTLEGLNITRNLARESVFVSSAVKQFYSEAFSS